MEVKASRVPSGLQAGEEAPVESEVTRAASPAWVTSSA